MFGDGRFARFVWRSARAGALLRLLTLRASLVSLLSVFLFALFASAGSLTPPGAPAGTMNTLAEVYDSIVGVFNSSSITANQNGSLMENLKYIESQLAWASNSNNVWLLSSGNVGIGDSTPEAKFEVAGTASVSSLIISGAGTITSAALATPTTWSFPNQSGDILLGGFSANNLQSWGVYSATLFYYPGNFLVNVADTTTGTGDVRAQSAYALLQASSVASGRSVGFVADPVARAAKIYTTGTKPTCSAVTRGHLWHTQSGAGVVDSFEICTKTVSDTYAWVRMDNGTNQSIFVNNASVSNTLEANIASVSQLYISGSSWGWPLLAPSGSSAAPRYSFSAATTAGFYYQSGTLNIQSANTGDRANIALNGANNLLRAYGGGGSLYASLTLSGNGANELRAGDGSLPSGTIRQDIIAESTAGNSQLRLFPNNNGFQLTNTGFASGGATAHVEGSANDRYIGVRIVDNVGGAQSYLQLGDAGGNAALAKLHVTNGSLSNTVTINPDGTLFSSNVSISGDFEVFGHAAIGDVSAINRSPYWGSLAIPELNVLTVSDEIDTVSGDPNVVGISNQLVLNLVADPGYAFFSAAENYLWLRSGASQDVYSAAGASNATFNDSAGDITLAYGTFSKVANTHASGLITSAYGVYSAVDNSGGTIDNAYAFYAQGPLGGAAIINRYGLYLETQTAPGVTNGWNIYSAGVTSRNYFEGNVGIGDSTPEAKLEVVGLASASIAQFGMSPLATGSFPSAANLDASAYVVRRLQNIPAFGGAALVAQGLWDKTSGTGVTAAGAWISGQTLQTNASNIGWLRGILSRAYHYGSGTAQTITSVDAQTRVGSGAGAVPSAVSVYGNATADAGTTVTTLEGLLSAISVNATANVTNAIGLRTVPTTTGTPAYLVGLFAGEAAVGTNNINLYLASSSGTAAAPPAIPTGNWSIYSASTRSSYFAGNLGINTKTPTTTLEVSGTASISGATTLRGVTYTWPSVQGAANTYLKNDGSGNLTWAAVASGVASNSLDFDEFVDSMTLDANLTVASAGYEATWYGNFHHMQGNVGIGTTNPLAKLAIETDVESAEGILVSNLNIGDAAAQVRIAGNTSYSVLVNTGDAWSNGMYGSVLTADMLGLISYANNGLLLGANAAAPMLFATADTERMRITPGGFVGVGTQEPDELVTVVGGNVKVMNLSDDVSLILKTAEIACPESCSVGSASFAFVNRMNLNRLDFTTSYNDVTNTLMTLTQSGFLGIGSSSPIATLAVEGTLKTTGNVAFGSDAYVYGTGTLIPPNFSFLSGEVSALFSTTITSSADFVVGIGNSLVYRPNANLGAHIFGQLSDVMLPYDLAQDISNVYDVSAGSFHVYQYSPYRIQGPISALQAWARLSGAGGTTGSVYGLDARVLVDMDSHAYSISGVRVDVNASNALVVNGLDITTAEASGSDSVVYGINLQKPGILGSHNASMSFGIYISDYTTTGSVAGFNIYSSGSNSLNYFAGRVSISGNFELSSRASIGGNVFMKGLSATAAGDDYVCRNPTTGEITFGANCTPSSIRFKENIQDLEHGLDLVSQLRPVTFDWKHNGSASLGFIAEEVERVSPLLALYQNGEIFSVNYQIMTAVLAKAIQEQQATIEALQAAINAPTIPLLAENDSSLLGRIIGLFRDILGIRFGQGSVSVEKLCVGSVCVTEEEFMRVFGAPSIREEGAEPDAPSPAPEVPTGNVNPSALPGDDLDDTGGVPSGSPQIRTRADENGSSGEPFGGSGGSVVDSH